MAVFWRPTSSVFRKTCLSHRWNYNLVSLISTTPIRCFSVSSTSSPWIRPAGEGGILLRFGTQINEEINKEVISYMSKLDKAKQLEGVIDVLPTYASLLVKFDPLKVSRAQVEQWCREATSSDLTSVDPVSKPRLISIPVNYGGENGPDIDIAARMAGLDSAEEVIRLHSSGDYRVYFLGFLGGFPYLGGLPAELTKVPRLETPRVRLPKGTVGIAGGQTGVYTVSTPGGWHCLGRTSMKLFDPAQNPPAALRAGDLVKFVVSDEEIIEDDTIKDVTFTAENQWIKVKSPGPLTTVQDTGRHGFARHGVSRSGAADDYALRLGNALLGNDESAAALEVTMGGLKFRCLDSCAISLTGADCDAKLIRGGKIATQKLPINEALQLQSDDEVELGFPEGGMRSYVCVRGGVDVPVVLGSRSTDIRTGLGGFQGRSLGVGDSLGRCASDSTKEQSLRSATPPTTNNRVWQLRVLLGPGDPQTDASPTKELQSLVDSKFKVLPRADRMAVVVTQEGKDEAKAASKRVEERQHIPYGLSEYIPPELIMGEWLNKPPLVGGQQMSEGCVSGTVQLPPDGNPVILLAEHQTTGGYKVPAVVIQADLWQVGQMRPGDTISFVQTTPEEAITALQQLRAAVQNNDVVATCNSESLVQTAASEKMSGREASPLTLHGEESSPRGHDHASGSFPSKLAKFSNVTSALVSGFQSTWRQSSLRCYAPGWRSFSSLVERSGSSLQYIDLNADCGEGFDDAGLLQYVTSANIACGAHAGTTESIAETVRLAAACGAGIGAHVSYVDREGFGRRALDTAPKELFDQVLWQASALDGLCRGYGTRVKYIKPHGALYHTVMSGGEQANAIVEAAKKLDLPLLLMPWSPWATYGEGFAERAYDGEKLRPRDKEGAVIHDPEEAAKQAVRLAALPNIHSVCVHGDSPNAVTVAKEVRQELEKNFALRPFCQ